MKLFLILIGMAAAGVLGYLTEPNFRLQFTGIAPEMESIEPTELTTSNPIELQTENPPSADTPAPADTEPIAIPEPEPAPAPTGDSAEPAPMPEPVIEPEPEPEPVPEPEPAPESFAAAGGPVDVVKTMQASIRSGDVEEFTYDQIIAWKALEDETVEGEVLNTGIVSYKAETIFGINTIQAKAHIKDGKVQRWFWPKSGMDIK